MITSKTNPKIKNLVKLQKAAERREQNRILIEGQREIERAQACGFEIEQLYVCEPLLREPVKVNAAFIETVTEEVFDKIAYREGSDGLLAVAIPKYKSLSEFKPKKDALIIVLETVEKPGNLGAVMRTADAAGAGPGGSLSAEPAAALPGQAGHRACRQRLVGGPSSAAASASLRGTDGSPGLLRHPPAPDCPAGGF